MGLCRSGRQARFRSRRRSTGHAEDLTNALKEAYADGWDLRTAVREAVKALSVAEGREIEADAIEAGVLERTRPQRRKFRRLRDDEVEQILAG